MLKAYLNKRTLIYVLELVVLVTMVFIVTITASAVIFILFKCFKFPIAWNINGIVFFVRQFDGIKELIAAALAIIALFFIIERINLMGEANYSVARAQWKKDLLETISINNIAIENPYMVVSFEQISDQLYKYLLRRNFVIYNKLMLRWFFWRYISDQVIEFEKNSKKSIDNDGWYPDENKVYSNDEAKKVLEFIFRFSLSYKTLISDFDYLYKHKVKAYAKTKIKKVAK